MLSFLFVNGLGRVCDACYLGLEAQTALKSGFLEHDVFIIPRRMLLLLLRLRTWHRFALILHSCVLFHPGSLSLGDLFFRLRHFLLRVDQDDLHFLPDQERPIELHSLVRLLEQLVNLVLQRVRLYTTFVFFLLFLRNALQFQDGLLLGSVLFVDFEAVVLQRVVFLDPLQLLVLSELLLTFSPLRELLSRRLVGVLVVILFSLHLSLLFPFVRGGLRVDKVDVLADAVPRDRCLAHLVLD